MANLKNPLQNLELVALNIIPGFQIQSFGPSFQI